MAVGAPTDIINIMIGTLVFFVALARVVTLVANRLEKRAAQKGTGGSTGSGGAEATSAATAVATVAVEKEADNA